MCVVKGDLLTSNKKAQEGGGERVEGTKAGTYWWWGGVSLSTSEKGARRTRREREVSPDRALCSPTFSHFLIVNNI